MKTFIPLSGLGLTRASALELVNRLNASFPETKSVLEWEPNGSIYEPYQNKLAFLAESQK